MELSSAIAQTSLTEEKRRVSIIGLSFFLLMFITAALQIMIGGAIGVFAESITPEPWFIWVLSTVPLYLIALPLCLLVIKNVDSMPIERRSFGAARFMVCLIICFGVMYAGNLVGLGITELLNYLVNVQPTNIIAEAVGSSTYLWTLLFAVLLVPIGEEFVFRKLLIGKMIRYGEKSAVFYSALFFALFHGNLNQFFYAFTLGAVFGYVYVKTGKLRYTIVMHMIINFVGTTFASVYTTSSSDSILAMMLIGLLVLFVFAIGIAGIVLLIVLRKRILFENGMLMLPRGKRFSTLWLNTGAILFVLTCLCLFVFNYMGRAGLL